MYIQNKQSGFTLVEMVVVISIIAIIGSLSSVIIGRTLESYAALDRRAELQNSVRLVVERISREVRLALPKSTCVTDIPPANSCSGATFPITVAKPAIYFIPVKSTGRYQSDAQGGRRPLLADNSSTNDGFHVLSASVNFPINAVTGDWVVVENSGFEIYGPPPASDLFVRQKIGGISLNESYKVRQFNLNSDAINYSSPVNDVKGFINPSPSFRFSVIDKNNQVTLFYKENNNLYRATTTFIEPTAVVSSPLTGSNVRRLLMENVTKCLFTYIPANTSLPLPSSTVPLLRIELTVEIDGEKIQIVHDTPVAQANNVP